MLLLLQHYYFLVRGTLWDRPRLSVWKKTETITKTKTPEKISNITTHHQRWRSHKLPSQVVTESFQRIRVELEIMYENTKPGNRGNKFSRSDIEENGMRNSIKLNTEMTGEEMKLGQLPAIPVVVGVLFGCLCTGFREPVSCFSDLVLRL